MTLTNNQVEKLERLRNYNTRYELILTNGKDYYLIRYTSRKSKKGIRNIGPDALTTAMEIANTQDFYPIPKQLGFKSQSTNWKIVFSGRTQRDAIIEGEYPFVLQNN